LSPAQPPVRIGSRASRLAQVQARWVQARITASLAAPPEEADRIAPIVLISTAGDRIQDRRLLEVGGKALFTKEIEQALLDRRIDCAVHSLKDVPAEIPPGLTLAAYPQREDSRDALVSPRSAGFGALPKGARLGTSSLRRQAQALIRRPDLQVVMLRGNVDTRLAKVEAGEVDAAVLAMAGLRRLGLADHVREAFDPISVPPAPGQGALAIETRAEDRDAAWVHPLHDPATELAIAAERGALEALEGSCRTAMGAHAWQADGRLRLVVEALAPDGSDRWRTEGEIPVAGAVSLLVAARTLGLELGHAVREAGGDRLVFG
jgi:hydroxymethylbilane synthase